MSPSLEIFTERQLRDTRIDSHAMKSVFQDTSIDSQSIQSLFQDARTASQGNKTLFQDGLGVISLGSSMSMSTEGQLLDLQDEQLRSEGDRDQMTFASMIFGSPLMLLGVSCSFAFADNSRLGKMQRLEQGLENRLQFQRTNGAVSAEALRRQQKSLAGSMEPISRQMADRIFDNLGEKKTKTMLSAVTSDGVTKRAEREKQQPKEIQREVKKVAADPIKLKKLLKEKEALTDYLEQMRGKLSLRSVSNVMARMEQLDKALKKLTN